MLIDFDMSIILMGCLILLGIIIYLNRIKKVDNTYILFFCIFFFYLIGVFKYTLFPIDLDYIDNKFDLQFFLKGINIIPFKFGQYTNFNYYFFRQILLNVILAIPFGFGISFIRKINNKIIIKTGIAFGITIETIQLVLSILLKYRYRIIDINDIILNFIGVMLGYSLFKLFAYIYVKIVIKYNYTLDSFAKYIYDVTLEHTRI